MSETRLPDRPSFTPSFASRLACSAATWGASVPSLRSTRHQGMPSSRWSACTTARAAPGFPAINATRA